MLTDSAHPSPPRVKPPVPHWPPLPSPLQVRAAYGADVSVYKHLQGRQESGLRGIQDGA